MIFEAKLSIDELFKFVENLRYEDKLEFENYLKFYSKETFFASCFDKNNKVYYLKNSINQPLALGGVYLKVENGYRIGQVWLLVTKEFSLNKKEILKYVFRKIEEFKSTHDFLYNYIYKSNFSSLKWLKKAGFKVCADLNNLDYKLFYFSKGAYFDIRYSPCSKSCWK